MAAYLDRPRLKLAMEIRTAFPAWEIQVIDDWKQARLRGIITLPAFVLDGELLVVGVPQKNGCCASSVCGLNLSHRNCHRDLSVHADERKCLITHNRRHKAMENRSCVYGYSASWLSPVHQSSVGRRIAGHRSSNAYRHTGGSYVTSRDSPSLLRMISVRPSMRMNPSSRNCPSVALTVSRLHPIRLAIS